MDALTTLDWRPVLLSLRVGAIATLVSVGLGSALGWALAHGRIPGRRWFEAAVLLPLVLPPTVLGWYLLVLMGRRGPVGKVWESITGDPLVFTWKAAVVAACASTVPIVARQMSAAFAALGRDATEAARLDGAGAWDMFARVHLPQVRGALAAAATIAFARAVGDFGATLMVAGNIPGETQTAALAIYDLMNVGKDTEAFVLVLLVSVLSMVVLALTTTKSDGR